MLYAFLVGRGGSDLLMSQIHGLRHVLKLIFFATPISPKKDFHQCLLRLALAHAYVVIFNVIIPICDWTNLVFYFSFTILRSTRYPYSGGLFVVDFKPVFNVTIVLLPSKFQFRVGVFVGVPQVYVRTRGHLDFFTVEVFEDFVLNDFYYVPSTSYLKTVAKRIVVVFGSNFNLCVKCLFFYMHNNAFPIG